MKLKDLLSIIPFYQTDQSIENIDITDIEMDSRKVRPGNAFVCISGFTVDGHQFAKDAEENGAAVIIAEKEVEAEIPVVLVSDTSRVLAMLAAKFFNYPTRKMPLIGITGTNGKTTITYLLEEIFQTNGEKTGLIGTIQMKIGEQTYAIDNTTPDSLFLQRAFKKMNEKNVNRAIMEVSSHALDLGRVYGTDFQVAVFTNLSQDHLDYHKDMGDYLRAKSLLFAQLGNNYDTDHPKFAIINADDETQDLLKRSTAQYVLTYGHENQADILAKNVRLDAQGTAFTMETPIGKVEVNSRLIGLFNVYNMLAAAAAAIASGVSLQVIKNAFEQTKGVSGRFEPVNEGQNYAVIVDYAHTPDSLENVLETVKGFAEKEIYVVVGCGGDRDRTKRPLMAQAALKYADHAFFTSDNPRSEDPQTILDDMVVGLEDQRGNFTVIVDRKEAIQQAVQRAEEGDIILIAGKGHETYQIVGKQKFHFDDRVVAKEAIAAKEI
jgi:UDP-N-acetylmuramoyl-L-alanyl-D-glutamate--2,6-diaminopimelate ligase